MIEEYILVREKRWWIPEFIFCLAVWFCRYVNPFFEDDLSNHPWLTFVFTKKVRDDDDV